ncbi:hypothetical protein [Sphingopyxis panaciterrulae]|uniref:Uncharacterized protein n=1 Tax=Sphingopyxis panaciterrulae TaxID=462372 RepID=A0A7W9ES66_9SPHN|nr:hypothetical protein [Sphingopyxis panaciterrulae]MBB5708433.1 hypothetical protein [Sphingopyxis panaciterrulae]
MGKIACIGWGSLIWNPGDLILEGDWQSDGPALPIEFLRQSSGNRLTLVISEATTPTTTLWANLRATSLPEAMEMLRIREGFRTNKWIGHWPSSDVHQVSSTIEEWAKDRNLNGVVWTAAPPKWNDSNGSAPSLEEAIAWLQSLGDDAKDAKEYVERAPEAVRTPFRDAFEMELGWIPKPDRGLSA